MSVAEDNIFQTAVNWLQEDRDVALATVIHTWGSSPRPSGSMLVVDKAGNFEGSVSGGCVEADVINTASECLDTGTTTTRKYEVSNEKAWEVGLACGGTIEIFIEPLHKEHASQLTLTILQDLVQSLLTKQSAVLIKDLQIAENRIWSENSPGQDEDINTRSKSVIDSDKCKRITENDSDLFFQPVNPALRMIIVGAVHIAQKLVPVAQTCGYHVIIVDPRQAFASTARFPDVDIINEWPDKAVTSLEPDRRTAIVTLTHDPKLDEPALEVALHSNAFYIGSLGSKRTHAARVQRLLERGLDAELLDRIHGPVGLDISASSAAEIAISIMAQVTETLRAE